MNSAPAELETLSADRVSRPEPWRRAIERRFSGRYPVDPFGLDPQLADLVTPVFSLLVPVKVFGEEHVPHEGPAIIVANRGLGVAEPAALAIAVRRATGRRLRIVGAPPVPFVRGISRRFGAIGASVEDVGVALRAGHLVGVPLAPTWFRTEAGIPPHGLMRAMTHAPIIPAAVTAGGPFGTALGAWNVHFGPLVTLADPYDPDDPLAAARFADAMRAAVAEQLVRE